MANDRETGWDMERGRVEGMTASLLGAAYDALERPRKAPRAKAAAAVEFDAERSAHYHRAMSMLPDARAEEAALALEALAPRPGERILEAGAGGGFFSLPIAEALFPGTLTATDPSADQLAALAARGVPNIEVVTGGADALPATLADGSYDAVWTGGAFHHVPDKRRAFLRFHALLKKGGRLVISDVFAGSALARHFDLEVAKHCLTGHDVSFLSDEYADSLCHLTGFKKARLVKRTIRWVFPSRQAMGVFLHGLHAMTKTTPEACGRRAEDILGVETSGGLVRLNWPLTVLTAEK